MPSKQQIQLNLQNALKNREELVISTLRMMLTAILNAEIEKHKKAEGLNDEEIISVLHREIKQRKDAISEYTKGERQDLAQKEQAEIDIIKKYLPEELSEMELNRIILETIKLTGATTIADFSKVMKEIMPKIKGRADGGYVSRIIKEKLS